MKTYQKTVPAFFFGLIFLIMAYPSFAFQILTRTVYATNAYGQQVQLQYTYYLNAAGQEVLHGTRTQYYLQTDPYTMNQVSVIERYSHGKKHGLEEAWYQGNFQYTIQKHWEREYQDGQLNGLNREWYQDSGYVSLEETYRNGKLHGPARAYHYENYPYNQTLEANYQDGQLHGHCKRWVLLKVGGYWTRYQMEEGDYAYGKKQGHWKTWCTDDPYSYNKSNPKNEGDYGNGTQCGRWATYNCNNWLTAPTYTYKAACQSALPPGVSSPFPGGNKYEIRGHVMDRDTNLPLAGVTVQAEAGSCTSDANGFYSLVLENGGAYTLNAVKEGYYDFSRSVSLSDAQYLDVAIAMKPLEEGGKPVITNVDAGSGAFFIEGFETLNEYAVSVNWNGGSPGTVRFEVNGAAIEETADKTGARHVFDMGADFTGNLSSTGNELKITAVNAAGIASNPEILNPIVIPLPAWSVKLGEGFTIKQDGKHLVYKLDTEWPEEPITIIVSEGYLGSTLWTLWGLVPYIGGRNFGIPDTQAFMALEARTDGTGSIAAGGQSGFEAAGGEIGIKLGAKGNLQYVPNVGLEWKETSLILGLEGKIEKEVGPVTLIPALEGAVNLPVVGRAVGWFNEKAKIKGSITAGAETALEIMSATGEIGFNRADVETGVELKLGMEVDLIDGLDAEVEGGGSGKLFWQVPASPDYFKKLETELAGSATLKFLGFEWTAEYTYPYTYPEEAEPQAMRRTFSSPAFRPLSRAFLDYAPYNVPAPVPVPVQQGQRLPMDTGVAGANTETKIVQNVFPYSEPAIAEHNGYAAIAYVYLDPSKPVHRDTDIYFTRMTPYNSYTLYEASPPSFVKSDTRADFAPTIAYDANGKIVCVWQRVKDPEFPADGTLADMAADMEIVYSVYNGTSWSEPWALTDNGWMDYNPILKRGANGNLMLVWFSNEGNLLVGSDDHPTTVHYALWNNTSASFSAPGSLSQTFADCFKFSFAYSGTAATLAWMKDMDGILVTPAGATVSASQDQEIFYATFDGSAWGDPVRVTDDSATPTPDANPRVAYRGNTVELVWLRGNDIVRLADWSSIPSVEVETIRTGVTAASLIDFSLYSDTNGRLTLLWQDSDAKGADLFYSVYDGAASLWSSPLRLTEGPAKEKNVQAAFSPTNSLYHLVFNRKEMTTGVTDLYHKTFKLASDLAVTASDLSVVPENPSPGDSVTLRCRVTNRGDLAVSNPVVKFYLGNPTAGGTLLPGGAVNLAPATLKAGEAGQAELAWTSSTDSSPYKIYAVVSAAGVTELTTANNTASFDVIKADLKAVRCLLERGPDGAGALRAEIRNDGLKVAENVAVLFKAQDMVIGTMTIPGLLPGKSAEIVYPALLDLYRYTTLDPRISVTADPDNLIQETREDNNTASFIHTLETVSPSFHTFGQVHYTGALGTVTVFNKTTAGIGIGTVSVEGSDAGDFRIFDSLSGTTLLPQQSGLLAVEFVPTSLGVKSAILHIRDIQGKTLWQVSLSGQLDYVIPGDVNDDSLVDLGDAILSLQVVAGQCPTDVYFAVDVDGDGKIGAGEALNALQTAAEMR